MSWSRWSWTRTAWFVVRNTPGVTSFVGGATSRASAASRSRSTRTKSSRSCGTWASRRPSTGSLHQGPERPGHRRPVRRVHRHGRRGQPGAQQGQGAGQHLRPRDARRARLPAGREALGQRNPTHRRGQEISSRPTLQLPAGKATPAPPVGTALGPHGINIVEFTKSYNEKTADKAGQIIPAQITIFEDRSFSFILKTPPAADLLARRPASTRARRRPARDASAGSRATRSARSPTIKMTDLNANDIEAAMRLIEGTARSMGIEVVG